MNRDILDFVTFCIGIVSRELNISRKETYLKLKSSGILDEYIVKDYDILHTYPDTYISEDIIDFMKKKGVLL